ncbi:peptidoglycan-binding protein [Flaviflexus massiliensis]|uniref:peptidoglycan-binding protein n=1 Tax=Flaviflexus massiliensis TaxID=1522309 RepID=UPI0006D59A4D|nr:peptidoglycan-binding protein [Flaviflexus massiliensis]
MARKTQRRHVHIAWLLVVLIAIALTWVSVRAISPPQVEQTAPERETYLVREGTLSRSVGLSGSATWETSTPGVSGAQGTLTEINLEDEIQAGTVVFSVNLVPTVAIEGAIPAFRDLEEGMTGPDVAQIQAFLGVEETGEFDAGTRTRVIEWQEEVGWEPTGVVSRSHILVLPALPTRAELADGVVLGATVAPGQPVVTTYTSTPRISVPTDPSDREAPAGGMTARIEIGGEEFPGILSVDDSLDGRTLEVVLDDGKSACIDTCPDLVPRGDNVPVRVVVDLVPETTGTLVPISALRAQPDGSAIVERTDGSEVVVEVTLSHGGQAIVDLDPGTEIFLFGSS